MNKQLIFVNIMLVSGIIFSLIVLFYGLWLTITGGNSGKIEWEQLINWTGGVATIVAVIYSALTLEGKNKKLANLVGISLAIVSVIVITFAFLVKVFPEEFKGYFSDYLHNKDKIYFSSHILSGLTLLSFFASLIRYDLKIKRNKSERIDTKES